MAHRTARSLAGARPSRVVKALTAGRDRSSTVGEALVTSSRSSHITLTVSGSNGLVTDSRSDVAHLLRRVGYGATPAELDQAAAAGYESTVERLLDPTLPDAADQIPLPDVSPPDLELREPTIGERQARNELRRLGREAITEWWINRMATSTSPLREKLTWFWHDHFATGIHKVNEPWLMLQQNLLFRQGAFGNFETLTQSVAKDPAMMIWLDSNKNVKGKPNENWARELMELFTMGVGTYTDNDVKEAARAFTGWKTNRNTGSFRLVRAQADEAPKTLLGATVTTGEQVLSLLVHRPETARYVAAKLWSFLAFPIGANDQLAYELSVGFATNLDIRALVRAILLHPRFRSIEARQGLVKEPVEFVVGSLRALEVQTAGIASRETLVRRTLLGLGQVPFDPPSVGGWPQNGYWLSTSSALTRLSFAQSVTGFASLAWLQGIPRSQRGDAIAARLALPTLTTATRAAIDAATTPQASLATALVSPEFVLN